MFLETLRLFAERWGLRKMWLRLNVRAAELSKKCCDKGANPSQGIGLAIVVEIELQLDYIPRDDHDGGGQSRCCGLGAGLSLQRRPAPP